MTEENMSWLALVFHTTALTSFYYNFTMDKIKDKGIAEN